jgi:FtsH-binding integral membrane protein
MDEFFLWYILNNSAYASGIFWVFLFLSLFNIFVARSPFISNAMAFVIAAIYCGYILVDTQLILGGKNKQLSLDNHILGSVILYVDIIGLFLKILQLLGEKKDKKR